jgi:hypothetical protein
MVFLFKLFFNPAIVLFICMVFLFKLFFLTLLLYCSFVCCFYLNFFSNPAIVLFIFMLFLFKLFFLTLLLYCSLLCCFYLSCLFESESMCRILFIVCLYIYCLVEFHFGRSGGSRSNRFNSSTCSFMFQSMTCLSIDINCGLFVFNDLMWEVVVRLVDWTSLLKFSQFTFFTHNNCQYV